MILFAPANCPPMLDVGRSDLAMAARLQVASKDAPDLPVSDERDSQDRGQGASSIEAAASLLVRTTDPPEDGHPDCFVNIIVVRSSGKRLRALQPTPG